MNVKICGITNLNDARYVIEAGADMLGYNLYPASKRYLHPLECARIQTKLGEDRVRIITVGVFVNVSFDEIITIMDECNLDLAQLSGDEDPSLVKMLGEKAFKGIRPRTLVEAQTLAEKFSGRISPPTLLLDTYRPGEYGGTGHIAEWDLALKLTEKEDILLAGGLHPGNVARAIESVRPWGVDVASGVESKPGIKDVTKVRKFISNARNAHVCV